MGFNQPCGKKNIEYRYVQIYVYIYYINSNMGIPSGVIKHDWQENHRGLAMEI